MPLTEIAAIAGPIVALIGAYLAYSHRRQIKLQVAEKRLAAYEALWDKMGIASPVRLTEWKAEPLTQQEREKLFDDFTAWYFKNGNGMFLGGRTRSVYLRVKDNLICDLAYYEPLSIREKLRQLPSERQEQARGYLSIRQLSLLRNRMKADLDVYGLPYHVDLDGDDKAFLDCCGEDLSSKPWIRRQRMPKKIDQNVKIFPKQES
ncbi:hypothetical protein [Halomonas cerina]|uniref:Uncharacterized protein n=1 Tax=Halomonas cerina TaxID=447424 RepID=A0A839V8R0_9GAMM|nr:hypothetical protein [Halomonas cerina]MBB3188946.1 hypothetical protein [Halomonas cerina]